MLHSPEHGSDTSAMAISETSQSRSESDEQEIEGEWEDTEMDDSVSEAEDQSAGEQGGGDDNASVLEYERLRQENIRKNRHRLQELGIVDLAMSLQSSGRTKNVRGVRGHHPIGQTSKVTANPRATSRSNSAVGYIA